MRFSKIILGLIAIVLAFGGVTVLPVGAQSSNASSAQGIQISPTFYELSVERGKTYSLDRLNVMNVTLTDLVYTVSIDDFTSSDETGTPRIITDSEMPTTASVKTWVSTIPEFTLHSHESRTVTAQVSIPADAEPGGHYGVLRFSGMAPEVDSTGVGLSASAGVLLLIRVDGDITEKASLASFFTSTNGDKQSSFFENSPITFVTRIKNDGNIHIKPSGDIEIRDMFGGLTESFTINRQEPRSNVLPDSIRNFKVTLNKPWMIGLYSASLTLGYGTTGQAITSTISFWVIPWKIILIGLLLIATILFILKRMVKVYNRHIIEKSKNENNDKNKKANKEKR